MVELLPAEGLVKRQERNYSNCKTVLKVGLHLTDRTKQSKTSSVVQEIQG